MASHILTIADAAAATITTAYNDQYRIYLSEGPMTRRCCGVHGLAAAWDLRIKHVPPGCAGNADAIVQFNPKRVLHEIFDRAGTVADINYLDENAQPQRVDGATLP